MTRQRCVYITSSNSNSKKSPWRLKRKNRTSPSEWKKSLKSINTDKTERATWRCNINLISIVIKVTGQLLPTLLPQAHTTYTCLFSTSLGFSLNPSLNLMQGNLPQPISLLIFLAVTMTRVTIIALQQQSLSYNFRCVFQFCTSNSMALNKSSFKLIRNKNLLD